MKRSGSARDEESTNGEWITRERRHIRDSCHVAARSEKVAREQKRTKFRMNRRSVLTIN